MNKEIPDHIYYKNDIDKAFIMGVDTALSVFEKTIGMSYDKQRHILNSLKNMLIEDKADLLMDRP